MKICTFLERTRDYKSWGWIQFVNTLIKHFYTHRGNWYRNYPGPYLHTRTSEYLRNCPCLCPQVEGEGIICLVLRFCLNMETQPPLIIDYVHSITSQTIQTWAVGIFWTVWLCLTYPWYRRHMQLNCQLHHFPHISQQQPCLPQSGTAASWSYPALQDMNWPSETGCLLQTSDSAKIKIQNKALIFAVN